MAAQVTASLSSTLMAQPLQKPVAFKICVADRAPAAGRGRIQRQVRRAFEACGPRLSASLVYDWARRWQRRHDGKRINQRERYSIVRVLTTMADRDGRADTRGRPTIWRLREPE